MVRYALRAEIRTRARALALLALLTVIIATAVMACMAGARRTETAIDRLQDATRAHDLVVQTDRDDVLERVVGVLRERPEVLAFAPVWTVPLGTSSESFDVALRADATGAWGSTVDRPKVLSGRRPRASATNEVMVSEGVARELHLGIGDRLAAETFTQPGLEAAISGEQFPGFHGPKLNLEVVGIARAADVFNGDRLSAGGDVIASAAFARRYQDHGMGGFTPSPAIRVRDPQRDVEPLVADLRRAAGADNELLAETADAQYADSARAALRVIAGALYLFAFVAAIAGLVVVAQAASREMATTRRDGLVLRGLGVSRGLAALVVALPQALAFAAAAVLTVVPVLVASRWFPFGFARDIEPAPGVAVDGPVLVVGAVVMVIAGAIWAIATAWFTLRSADARRTRVPVLAQWCARAGARPPVVLGALHAANPSGRRRGLAASAFLMTVIAVAGVVGAAAFDRSLQRLVASPQRWGWNWSSTPDFTPEDRDEALRAVAADPDLAAVASATTTVVRLAAVNGSGDVLGMSIDDVRGHTPLTVRSGRAPERTGEVAVGAHTMKRAGLHIGDRLELKTADEDVQGFTVVGTAVFPTVDNPDPGDGVWLTASDLQEAKRSSGDQGLVLTYASDADPAAVEHRLAEQFPNEIGFSPYSRERMPGQIRNLGRAQGIAGAVGLFFALIGVMAMANALFVAARRRRAEFGVIRAMGMTTGQARRVVDSHALIAGLVGVFVGVPLGLIVGRLVWRVTTDDLGVVASAARPALVLALVLPAVLLVAWVIAWWPARRVSNLSVAGTLRAE